MPVTSVGGSQPAAVGTPARGAGRDAVGTPARGAADAGVGTPAEIGTRRRPPEVRRRMLLDAARQVIAERGLHATTIRDVATAGQVAVGTVTYHFSGIEEVLAGVLASEMDSYSAPIWERARTAVSGREGVQTLLTGLMASDQRTREHWKLWLDFWTLAAHQPEYATWQSRVYQDLHQLVETLLRRGGQDGSLRVNDPAAEAVELVALLDGLVVQSYLPGGRLSPRRAREMLLSYLDATMSVDGRSHRRL